jgi:hypothetical protein
LIRAHATVPMPTLHLHVYLGLGDSRCVFRIRPGRKPDTWVFIIDRGDGSKATAGQVGWEAALALRAELIAEADELRRLGWCDVVGG